MLVSAILIAFASFYDVQGCNEGFDTTNAVSVDEFQCLLNNNFTYFIARIYKNTGQVDTTGIQNLINARKGKFFLFI